MPAGVEVLSASPVVTPYGDMRYANPGAVVRGSDGTWHMLRNSFSRFPGPSRTDHLTSADGLSWTVRSRTPALTSGDVPYAADDHTVFVMSAYVGPDDAWVAHLYTIDGTTGSGVVGRAAAPEPGGPWTVDPAPLLTPGPEGRWDHERLAQPSVVTTPDGLVMYYAGYDASGAGSIGRATSVDGISWHRLDNPVLEPAADWEGGGIDDVKAVLTPCGTVLLYRAQPGLTEPGIGVAWSADGATWQRSVCNPILTSQSAPGGPATFWQSALAPEGDGTTSLWWLEVGSSTTAIHVLRLRWDALLDDPSDVKSSRPQNDREPSRESG
jgi:hypothetical protein